ncbi:MAG TPA: arylamine N-acetyltransferase [Pyrinomonadaceae bacterium]|nr:arylamine N-acetyltransferase [Pyrinomonadaceae bacterium]
MDINAYLKRINYRGSLASTADTLRELQVRHLQTIPFENLSIHAAQPIVLNDDALFEKIVGRRRGGFCYELNGLFAALLRELGFDVNMLSARVANSEGVYGPEFDHMTLLVVPAEGEPRERWLADVGFGDSFLEPLQLDSRQEQPQRERAYKIIEDQGQFVMMQRKGTDEWECQYSFTLQPYGYPDYSAMCLFHQTSPESHFTKARVCTRATPEGRVTLSEMRLITTIHVRERTERLLTSDTEYSSILNEQFGVVI